MKKFIILTAILILGMLGMACDPGTANKATNATNTMSNTTNSMANDVNSMANDANTSNNTNTNSNISNNKVSKSKEFLFPFPAPKPTRYEMKDLNEIAKSEIISELKQLLRKAKFEQDDYRYFEEEDDFAFVTKIEQVNENGERLRMNLQESDIGAKSCQTSDYINCLIFGKKFYYRSMAFVVTDDEISIDSPPTFEQVINWFKKTPIPDSPNTTDAKGEEIILGRGYKLAVLIYIFEYETGQDEITFRTEFPISTLKQLKTLNVEF